LVPASTKGFRDFRCSGNKHGKQRININSFLIASTVLRHFSHEFPSKPQPQLQHHRAVLVLLHGIPKLQGGIEGIQSMVTTNGLPAFFAKGGCLRNGRARIAADGLAGHAGRAGRCLQYLYGKIAFQISARWNSLVAR
jgi:hypothetical protein